MGQLYIPGNRKEHGPWLLSKIQIEELDEIFEFINEKIEESTYLEQLQQDKNKQYSKEEITESDKKTSSCHINKSVKIISTDEKILSDLTIKGILKDSKLKDFKPNEFLLETKTSSSNQFSLRIKRYSEGELSYSIKCYDSNCEDEIKYKIDNWIDKNMPTKAKQIWSDYFSIIAFISFFVVFFSSLSIYTTDTPDFKSIYQNQINEICKTGVNSENLNQAIELILKFNLNYIPEGIKEVSRINKTNLEISIISFLIFILAIFRPKTTFEIGKHKKLYNFYCVYTKTVLYTLPILVFIPQLIDIIKRMI